RWAREAGTDAVAALDVRRQAIAALPRADPGVPRCLVVMAEPADVRVDVYNGGAPSGSAQNALDWLQNKQGVLKSTNKSNAPENVKKTQLVYAPNQADQARRLADMMGLSASALKPTTTDAGERDPMVRTLGP
ncbi:LytR C-terminal domain-containing protein, partial [Streptomyces exfoliatus]|uniref:LytR C-terminal domain-containing protein n=1 Tax=Streptomyces exfoliatus TaxID=1905 RepID=UPI0004C97A27